MIRKSLYFGALAAALVWSAAAQATPGETTQTVNLRSGPSTSYAIVGRIHAGAPVDILKCRNWCELSNGQSTGWVRANSVVAESAFAPYAYPSEPSLNGISDGFYADNGPWSDGVHHHHEVGGGGGHGGMSGGIGLSGGHGAGEGSSHGGSGGNHH